MKLRNKKTGEIGWLETYYGETDEKMIAVLDKKIEYHPYNSLAELNEEWEDYEELIEYWRIDGDEVVLEENSDFSFDRGCKEIGNYFETREEAEKAVEKLKAFKRLKDKGFRFVGRSIRDLTITYSFDNYGESDIPQMNNDLDLLFGGEDE